jgi:DNA repair exonuclease SbcCD ATPase subunit
MPRTSPDQQSAQHRDGVTDRPSTLDRRRERSARARQQLDQARDRLADVDKRLSEHAGRASQVEHALRAAQDEVKRLKKALKDGAKERQKLISARKRAGSDVNKAERKAKQSESKYDEAVLAELVRREKSHDRQSAAKKRSTPKATSGGPQEADGAQPPTTSSRGRRMGCRSRTARRRTSLTRPGGPRRPPRVRARRLHRRTPVQPRPAARPRG